MMRSPWIDERLASNGRAIKENFSNWFLQSKVVDSNGTPVMAFHGTVKDFGEFDLSKTIHFERDRGKAFFYSCPAAASDYAQSMADYMTGNANVMPVYLAMNVPYIIEVDGSPSEEWDMAGGRFEREAPHWVDGYIVHGTNWDGQKETMYVATRPHQIKSAIGNSGLYSCQCAEMTDQKEHELICLAAKRQDMASELFGKK